MLNRAENYIPQQYLYHLGEDGSVVGKTKIQPRGLEEAKEQFPQELPFADLVESIREAAEKAAETPNPFEGQDIQRIVVNFAIGHTNSFDSTGDPEYDKLIEMGLNYKRSCVDLTNSGDFMPMIRSLDYTGMNDAEKYKAIYEVFQHCYGENFFDMNAIMYFELDYGRDSYRTICNNFSNQIRSVFGDDEAAIQKIRREALYGGMSDYEVRKTIMEKYMEDGNITLRNLFKAAHEMDSCGVGGAMLFAMIDFGDGVESIFDSLSREDHFFVREQNMDQFVTPKLFQQLQRMCENQVYFCNGDPKKMAAVNQIIAMCGGGYGSVESSSGFVSKSAIEEMFSRMGYTRTGI